MKLEFHPAALSEMIDAASYYDQQQSGLGREFESAVEAGFERILAGPQRWPVQIHDVRRHRLKRFPYGIHYRCSDETVTIIAVMHFRRGPSYWMDRL